MRPRRQWWIYPPDSPVLLPYPVRHPGRALRRIMAARPNAEMGAIFWTGDNWTHNLSIDRCPDCGEWRDDTAYRTPRTPEFRRWHERRAKMLRRIGLTLTCTCRRTP
jgi:hypothetical protein